MKNNTPPIQVVKSAAALISSLANISVDEVELSRLLEPLFSKIGTCREIARYLGIKSDTLKHFVSYSNIECIGTRRGAKVYDFVEVVNRYNEVKRIDRTQKTKDAEATE